MGPPDDPHYQDGRENADPQQNRPGELGRVVLIPVRAVERVYERVRPLVHLNAVVIHVVLVCEGALLLDAGYRAHPAALGRGRIHQATVVRTTRHVKRARVQIAEIPIRLAANRELKRHQNPKHF